MTNPLTDAYLILDKVYCQGKYLKQAISCTPTDPQTRAKTVKVCYGVMEKDIYLNFIIDSNAKKAPKRAVKLIIKIALYMLEFMDKHDYMVVNNAVELCKKLGKEGAASFVNAFLRSYAVPILPVKEDDKLSILSSSPLWLAKKVRRTYKKEALDILTAPSKGLCVRFVRGEERYLNRPHIETPYKGVYIFPSFIRDECFFLGDYTFQSPGSIAVCDIIEPCDNFLDACAAPGGKSVLLSSKCKHIVAEELYSHRVELIRAYIKRMGPTNITPVCADAAVFNPEWDSLYDGVLCDVPCSGTGVINENPDIKYFRDEDDIPSLMMVQQEILATCSRYVKPGGCLYYSTCSILPEENDSTVYDFLKTHENFEAETSSSSLEHRQTKEGLQFLPHISMGAGFYVCKMRRKS